MQSDAVTCPPVLGDCPEEFEGAAVLPQKHPPNRGGELRSDPGVGHVADVLRRARVAPDDLGPMPPTLRSSAREHDREQPERVIKSAQGHEGVEVAQRIRSVVSLEIRVADQLDTVGGEVIGRREKLARKDILDPAWFEGDGRRSWIDVLTIGRARDEAFPKNLGSQPDGACEVRGERLAL